VHRSGYLALITVVLGLLSGAADSVCQQRQSERNSLPILTTAHDVHRLTSDHAAQNYPVHLRAVVTYCDPYIDPRHPTVWISDSSGGIYASVSGCFPPWPLDTFLRRDTRRIYRVCTMPYSR
jgi:hypothetical protein